MSAEIARAKTAAAITLAYHRVFKSEDGKAVLADMRAAFGLHMPAFIPQTRGRHCEYDPTHAAIRDGQRQVVLHIDAKLEQTPKADGNEEKPKTRVKK
jgi:hypothetical protein